MSGDKISGSAYIIGGQMAEGYEPPSMSLNPAAHLASDELGQLRRRVSWLEEHYEAVMNERDAATARAERAEAAIQRVRALHSPKPGWERQWKDPAEALARGWVECAGCEIQPAGAGRYLDACRTLAALDGTDNTGGTDA